MAKTDLPILEQRRIEANIVKPIYEALKAEIGTDAAQRIIGKAVVESAIAAGAAYAEAHPLDPDWRARTPLYQLYPLLVHVELFGAGYAESLRRALDAVR